jgi:hypothetical protein
MTKRKSRKAQRTRRTRAEKLALIKRVDAGESPESLGLKMDQIYSWRWELKQAKPKSTKGTPKNRPAKSGAASNGSAEGGHVEDSMSVEDASLEAAAKALDLRGILPSQLLTSDLLFLHARRRRIGDSN